MLFSPGVPNNFSVLAHVVCLSLTPKGGPRGKHICFGFAMGKHMSNRFDVGAPIVRKYVDMVRDVLHDKNKLFGKYINMSFKEQPLGVIYQYQEFTCLPNICGAIGGTHIPLTKRPSRRYILVMSNYYNQRRFHSIIVQAICDAKYFFCNVCVG